MQSLYMLFERSKRPASRSILQSGNFKYKFSISASYMYSQVNYVYKFNFAIPYIGRAITIGYIT